MAELTEDQKKIADLEKQVATLTKGKADAEKQVADAIKVVADLKDQLAEKKAGIVELPTVSVGKETYELVGGGFMYNGEEVTLERLKEDTKLAAELVKEGVGNLRKLSK